MNQTESNKIPEHQRIYQRIHDAILFGELVPGQAVTIQGLSNMVGAGATPIREAMRRLTAEGALLAMENRRILVPEVSESQLVELRYARNAIEPHLAMIALNNMDSSDLSNLIATDEKLNSAIEVGSVEKYLYHNYQFHFQLYQHANFDILLDLARALWLRVGPSLRVVCGRYGTANLPDMHDQAIQAIRDGDMDALRVSIEADINQGMDQIARTFKVPDRGSVNPTPLGGMG